ncbi:hypothetical protein Scep_019891 [Stephania cephalantha]|uniref:Uncharacterized protein n=1 Tax=Stephania cephalantha TaxID=152367 RepID=A0AAP0NLV0_9MAGN
MLSDTCIFGNVDKCLSVLLFYISYSTSFFMTVAADPSSSKPGKEKISDYLLAIGVLLPHIL